MRHTLIKRSRDVVLSSKKAAGLIVIPVRCVREDTWTNLHWYKCDKNWLFATSDEHRQCPETRRGDVGKRVDGRRGGGSSNGPHKAGCDFNMGGSQSHYRLQSEEHRGQTWSKPTLTSANGILLSASTPSIHTHTHPAPQKHTHFLPKLTTSSFNTHTLYLLRASP